MTSTTASEVATRLGVECRDCIWEALMDVQIVRNRLYRTTGDSVIDMLDPGSTVLIGADEQQDFEDRLESEHKFNHRRDR